MKSEFLGLTNQVIGRTARLCRDIERLAASGETARAAKAARQFTAAVGPSARRTSPIADSI